MMKKINLLFLGFLLVGCNNQKVSSSNQYSGTWETIFAPSVIATHGGKVNPFNTSMSLKYFIDSNLDNKETIIEEVTSIYQNNIINLHQKFDRHNSYYLDQNDKEKGKYSNIKTINESLDTGNPVKLDKETFDLLKLGVEFTKYTEGYFNIFVGELTDYWDDIFYDKYNFGDDSKDPLKDEDQQVLLENLVKCIPNSNEEFDEVLIFNDNTYEVTFNSLKDEDGESLGNLSISVGGIAKGYATDLLKEKLVEEGYNQGYLFSGSSSISSLSTPISNNEKGQYLSVLDPRTAGVLGESKAAFGINLKDEFSMSTSGNYTAGKSYKIKDEKDNYITRHHIINSFTGYPEYKEGIASVSVFSKKLSAGVLDAFSTTLVNKTLEDGLKFREKVINDESLEKPDLEIVYIKENIIENTIEVITTSDFNGTFKIVDSEGINVRYVK